MTNTSQRAAAALLGLLVVIQTVLHLDNAFGAKDPALDVNAEGTVFALLAAGAMTLTAAGWLLLVARRRVSTRPALVLAVLLLFFAFDEVTAVHERVGVRVALLLGLSRSWDSVLWPVVYLPLLATVVALTVWLGLRAAEDVRRLALQGLALLAVAVVLEVLSAPFSTPTTGAGLVHALEGAAEEACELGGWGLLALSSLSWALRRAPAEQRTA